MNNSITIKPISTEGELWHAEKLYLESFPLAERRETRDWIEYTWNKPEFHNNVIMHGENIVGFISYWEFPDFVYVEHFAMNKAIRGHGIGGKALDQLLLHYNMSKPIILEVEKPTDELSKRRIEFYSRHGFSLRPEQYSQPPYRQHDDPVEMKIMVHTLKPASFTFDATISTLKKEVYGV